MWALPSRSAWHWGSDTCSRASMRCCHASLHLGAMITSIAPWQEEHDWTGDAAGRSMLHPTVERRYHCPATHRQESTEFPVDLAYGGWITASRDAPQPLSGLDYSVRYGPRVFVGAVRSAKHRERGNPHCKVVRKSPLSFAHSHGRREHVPQGSARRANPAVPLPKGVSLPAHRQIEDAPAAQ